MVFVCHVILRDQVIKGICDFITAQFGGHGHCGSGNIMILVLVNG